MSTIAALMLTGVILERAIFLDRCETSSDVSYGRVVRNSLLVAQKGTGIPVSVPCDDKSPIILSTSMDYNRDHGNKNAVVFRKSAPMHILAHRLHVTP